ncbi:MAG: FAD-binding oxidoreductase [Desulfobacterales bacterium]|nr:FAD-binding oxidoreductase [Desulfobacterales bacterium]
MNTKEKLIEIFGADRVDDSAETLNAYSTDFSLTPPGTAACVVFPETSLEIQALVIFANEQHVPIIPCSSRVHFRGTTIPRQGGVVLDLQRMNKILSYNERNRYVQVQPGVTWGQVQAELEGRGAMVASTLLPHPDQSVVTTFLEREPLVISLFEYNEPLMSMEVVWPDGSIFRTGSASAPNFPKTFVEGTNPMGPGTLDFFRLIQGAQGTMGIVTWAMLKTEYFAPESRPFFMKFDRVADAIEPLYNIQRKKIGYECFLINRLNLASILSGHTGEDFKTVANKLPAWTLMVILRSARYRPEEKFAYEQDALMDIAKGFHGMEVNSYLPGLPASGNQLARMLRKPWQGRTYWKHALQGNCQELFFITKMSKVAGFVDTMSAVAGKNGFPISRIGCYVQPIDNGRACHCEFDLFYDKEDPDQIETVKSLTKEAAETLYGQGAFFTRPYGMLSDMVYSKTADYTAALKKVKRMFDPNNILAPGNLCF